MPAFPRTSLRDLADGAARFARAVPALASTLSRPVAEPMTERLVEGISVLGATVLDKALAAQRYAYELLAERACPWLRRPLPASAVVAFDPTTSGRVVVSPSTLLQSAPIDGVRCTFRPVREVVVAPYCADGASIEARPGGPTVLRFELRGTGIEPVNGVLQEGATFYIDGELETALQIVHALTSDVSRAVAESPAWRRGVEIPREGIVRGELEPEAALAPDPDGRPQPMGAFVEATVFPHKFRFVRIPAVPAVAGEAPADRVTLSFHLKDMSLLEARLGPRDVRAHCVPVANLFVASAEPLPLDVELGEVPLRVVGLPPRGGGVYSVLEAFAVAQRGEHPPLPLPNARRLAAAPTDARCPAVFATSVAEGAGGDPDVTVMFGRRAGAAGDDEVARTISMSVMATNRALGGRVRTGDLAGALRVGAQVVGFRNVTPASPYVPAPSGGAFALRVTRSARLTAGMPGSLAALKDALFTSVPSWVGRTEWIRAQHLRIAALEGLEVGVARRVGPEGEVRRGYAFRAVVDESAFRGSGELALFGATIGEALSRSMPIGAFVELSLVGRRGTFSSVHPKKGERR